MRWKEKTEIQIMLSKEVTSLYRIIYPGEDLKVHINLNLFK